MHDAEPAFEDPFAALGDPNRRRIVELLAARSRSVGELADEMPISRPAVSRHLRLLKQAGLVSEAADGTRRIYQLHDEGVAETPEDFGSEEEFHELFTTPPVWALPKGNRLGLPIAASGWTDDRYKKE